MISPTPILLDTLRGIKSSRPPIWLMRQAGRSLPEYQKIRRQHSMLELIRTPELAATVTLQPIERFGMDGAVIFADILNPLIGMGMELDFIEGKGPVFSNPVRSHRDIIKLKATDPCESVAYTMQAHKLVKKNLAGKGVTLIGFCGAPFSLSYYMIEGVSSKDGLKVKGLMMDSPDDWKLLQDKLVSFLVDYLVAQAEAGAECLQIFDSSVGLLSPWQYETYVLPWVEELVFKVKERIDVPLLYFPFNGGNLLSLIAKLPVDAVSIDWRQNLRDADVLLNKTNEGADVKALQGNVDPALLCGKIESLEVQTKRILNEGALLRKPFVVNLGHGVLPESRIENIARMVEIVKEFKY
jgi:uroporphyrinogen decarboxylase